jgi:hypothetical protein
LDDIFTACPHSAQYPEPGTIGVLQFGHSEPNNCDLVISVPSFSVERSLRKRCLHLPQKAAPGTIAALQAGQRPVGAFRGSFGEDMEAVFSRQNGQDS